LLGGYDAAAQISFNLCKETVMTRDVRRMFVMCCCGVALTVSSSAGAATLCVGSQPGCFSTIGAAVAAASAGDTINVAQGIYPEDVEITKSVSLIGKNPANTIIDATGLANGIYINGLGLPNNNPPLGVSHVTVSGFTIRNANFEGVLLTNASSVTFDNNRVTGNDRGIVFTDAGPTCPGIPDFETAEGFDCGEGVHLIGVDHSVFSNNLIENNAGGFLVSDETGPTHDNTITGNVVRNNVLDCGITIPTHPSSPQFQPRAPFGIYGNTISNNVVSGNGVNGVGAGVGLFGFIPGGRVSDNVVTGNIITGNGLPGIAVHAHSPGLNIGNNSFIGNYIAANGQDSGDSATPGTTGINIYSLFPIYGNVVAQNVIKSEEINIVFNIAVPVGPTASLEAHDNNLNGPAIGVDNLGVGVVNATNNWWGCANGPNANGCSSVEGVGVQDTPFLSSPAVPNGSPTAQH
jgi:parallel beta-helix repeat protein